MALATQDATSGDRSPKVTIEINGTEYTNIREYSWASDVTILGDDFACTIGNDEGALSGQIRLGQSLKVYVADPDVNGGARTLKLTGLVTRVEHISDFQQGSMIMVQGADLGWHLLKNDAPLWLNLRGINFKKLLDICVNPAAADPRQPDPGWGFAGTRTDNNTNRSLRLGRAGLAQIINPQLGAVIPRIQVEPGEKLADLLITYAKREKLLVNVSADGYLQVFKPTYTGDALYKIEYHRSDEAERVRNNVLPPVRWIQDIEGIYSRVICVGTVVQPAALGDTTNPNEGKFRGEYSPGSSAAATTTTSSSPSADSPLPITLPFARTMSFADGEQLTKARAAARAQWRWQRGQFDAWQYNVTLDGHSQNGSFFEADTLISIDDTVHGIRGRYYVRGVRYNRTLNKDGGTQTVLTIHKPDLLSA